MKMFRIISLVLFTGIVVLLLGVGAQSPQKPQIVFHSNRDDASFDDIYVMDQDGSNIRRLTNTPGFYDEIPDWSPDGQKIVFCSTRDENLELYVMNADGSDKRNLTKNSVEDYMPSWSPDGKKIAFRSARDGNYEVYVVDADGKN
ncbi:hypothetical protein FJZ33_13770 [Candidatus Poribacteria bacterium]|nr:hypothetical protein [Candidatus Poribacteria bacterium]